MMLSTKARYAVTAMVYIACHEGEPRPVSLSEVSEAQNIPLSFLEQIFMQLRQSGLVKSMRGPGGGYNLARGSDGIHISDILAAVSESVKMTRCEEHESSGCLHDKSRCLTHGLWQSLTDHIHAYFSGISLRDVCSREMRAGSGNNEVMVASL